MRGHGDSLRMRRKWKHRTQKHSTLDVDWLITFTSGKTTVHSPWDEDNGSTIICVTAPRVRVIQYVYATLVVCV